MPNSPMAPRVAAGSSKRGLAETAVSAPVDVSNDSAKKQKVTGVASPSPAKGKTVSASPTSPKQKGGVSLLQNLASAPKRPGGLLDQLRSRGMLPMVGSEGVVASKPLAPPAAISNTPPRVRTGGTEFQSPRTESKPTAVASGSSPRNPAGAFLDLERPTSGYNASASPSNAANHASVPASATSPGVTPVMSISGLLPQAAASATSAGNASASGDVRQARKGSAEARKGSAGSLDDDDDDDEPKRRGRKAKAKGRPKAAASAAAAAATALMPPPAATGKKKPPPRPLPPRFSAGPEAVVSEETLVKWREHRSVPLPPVDPEDEYAITDKEDSDDEFAEQRQEEARLTKHVPAWSCDAAAVKKVAEDQGKVDPDCIFGELTKLDLDEVFPDSLYRAHRCINPKRRRGSSQLWFGDRLRRCEVMEYKSKMGQKRRWSILPALRRRAIPHKVTAESNRAPAAAGPPTLAGANAAMTVAALDANKHVDAPLPLASVATPSRKDGSDSNDGGGTGRPVAPNASPEECVHASMVPADPILNVASATEGKGQALRRMRRVVDDDD